MKQFKILAASIALTMFGLCPALVLADDELDVTMEVLDSVADIDGEVLEMRGPDGDDFADSNDGESDDGESDGEGAGLELAEARNEAGATANGFFEEEQARESDFEGDSDFRSDDDEEHFEEESNFDENEEIDDDAPDIEDVA